MHNRPQISSRRILNALRSDITSEIADRIEHHKGTQTSLAAELRATRSQINKLRHGNTDGFSFDWLINCALRLGFNVRLAVTRPYSKHD